MGIQDALDGAISMAAPSEIIESEHHPFVIVKLRLKLWRRLLWWCAERDRNMARTVLRENVAAGVVWRLDT